MNLSDVTKEDILKVLPLPSAAIKAMIEGLAEWEANPECRIDLMTFGREKEDICNGCCATATIYKALDISPQEAVAVGLSVAIQRFEDVIDQLRLGNPDALFIYYDVPKEVREAVTGTYLPMLGPSTWKQRISHYAYLRSRLFLLGY